MPDFNRKYLFKKEKIDELSQEAIELNEEITHLRETIAELRAENTSLTEANTSLAEANTSLSEDNQVLEDNIVALTHHNNVLQDQLETEGIQPDPFNPMGGIGIVEQVQNTNPQHAPQDPQPHANIIPAQEDGNQEPQQPQEISDQFGSGKK